MTKVDQFESVFRSAAKEVYTFGRVAVEKVLVVVDLDAERAEAFTARLRAFLQVLGDEPEWTTVVPGELADLGRLLERLEREPPDLICTYRNLGSEAWKWPHSLGATLDVLAQVAPCPVLVLPHPDAGREYEHALHDTDRVMAITDHLVGEARLVDHAVHFTQPGGTLYLTHVEDERIFERYVEVISKIPTIDTEDARESILAQLLKEPRDYVRSCAEALAKAAVPVTTEPVVTLGHALAQYRAMVEERSIDLLVMCTRDEDQLAMHGFAYPLAVELRGVPLLLL